MTAPPPPPPPAIVRELRRLVGQSVDVRPAGDYVITDVAGEGRPVVGIVERRGRELWLEPTDADAGAPALRLSGVLAKPRIAGPGYKVWVIGSIDQDGSLRARRLGVLAHPRTVRAKGTP